MSATIYIIKVIGLALDMLISILLLKIAKEKVAIALSACCVGMCAMGLIYSWLVEGTWVI